MAGFIADAEIMFGGRTPHPYHTRPGMVSQSNDGDPHGKPRADTEQERSPRYPGVRGTGSLSAPPLRPCRTGTWPRSVTSTTRPRRRCGAVLATEPADRHATRLYGSS